MFMPGYNLGVHAFHRRATDQEITGMLMPGCNLGVHAFHRRRDEIRKSQDVHARMQFGSSCLPPEGPPDQIMRDVFKPGDQLFQP
jgi:hypothetical protein